MNRQERLTSRALVATVLVGLVATAVPAALGGGRDVLDFRSARPAPKEIAVDLNRQLRMNRYYEGTVQRLTAGPRTVIDREDERGHTKVAVAPTSDGGFCWAMNVESVAGAHSTSVSCLSEPEIRRTKLSSDGFSTSYLSGSPDIEAGYADFTGYLALPAARTLAARYEDGAREEISFTWVSKPVSAGFFAFSPADEHRAGPGTRIVAITALDAGGRRLARQLFTYSTAESRAWNALWNVPQCCGRSDQNRLFPAAADLSRARRLVLPQLPHWAPQVWAAPAGTGGMCWAYLPKGAPVSRPSFETDTAGVSRGCEQNAGINGGNSLTASVPPGLIRGPNATSGPHLGMLLFGSVEARVRSAELLFQDGARASTKPVSRIVAYAIPRKQWARGRRLNRVILRDGRGREVRSFAFDQKAHGYPCKKPIDFGGGFTQCP